MKWIVKEAEGMKKIRFMVALAMICAGVSVHAQMPQAPEMSPATADVQKATEPQAPTPHAAEASPFPAANPKNFTAGSPTQAEVNEFLKTVWGYDDNLVWSVAGIQKTPAPGVARVVVFIANKSDPKKISENVFFVTPDGKHAIANAVIDFGATPYAERRKMLEDQANGPAEGAQSKDLLLVEFADLLNGKSKEAQDKINNLVKDIPQVRLVFESLPDAASRYAMHAAAEGVCVRKAKGDGAFFTYTQAVFNKQEGLTSATLDPALSAAVTAAGEDPKSVAACAASPEAMDEVKASIALGNSVGVEKSPVLVINGRVLDPADIPYETLKTIIAYQAQLDGLTVHVQPSLSNLK